MKKTLRTLLIAAVWLAIWQVSAMLVGQELLIPAPAAVLARLWALCGQGAFWKSVALSMGRIDVYKRQLGEHLIQQRDYFPL